MNHHIIILPLFMRIFCCASVERTKKALEGVIASNNKFSNRLFIDYATRNNDPNLIMSPLSVWTALSMSSFGARGQTLEEMRRSLFIPSYHALTGYRSLTKELNSVKNIDLVLRNNLYVSKDFNLYIAYKTILNYFIGSNISNFDSSKPYKAAHGINKWVSGATNGKIKELVNKDDISKDIRMILLNAVYFKADWKIKFNPGNTKWMPFYTGSNRKKYVPTMVVEDEFFGGYLEDLKADFIQLPYKNEDAQMTIVVPADKSTSVENLINNLDFLNASRFEKSGSHDKVSLYLPKFKIDSTIDLNASLQKLGMQDMFSSKANFKDMSDEPLQISKVKQKAMIEVNEEGSVAAVATVGSLSTRSDVGLIVNRPFLFWITVKNVTVLMGRLDDPLY